MRRTSFIALVFIIAALAASSTAFAHSYSGRTLSDARVGTSKQELVAQENYSQGVISRITSKSNRWRIAPRHATCWSHVLWARVCNQARTRLIAHRWLYKVASRRYERLYAPKPVVASGAQAWYADGATQCEVSHEGGWTTMSSLGYAGRFQSDYSFETSSAFGRSMEARYGRANNWPSWAQVQHAYEEFLSRGWGPWPPYYKYGCAAYHGRSYP